MPGRSTHVHAGLLEIRLQVLDDLAPDQLPSLVGVSAHVEVLPTARAHELLQLGELLRVLAVPLQEALERQVVQTHGVVAALFLLRAGQVLGVLQLEHVAERGYHLPPPTCRQELGDLPSLGRRLHYHEPTIC